jgi:hypothetical protein
MGCLYHLRCLSCHLMLSRHGSPSMLAQLAHNSYWFPGFPQPRPQKSQTRAPPAQHKIAALRSIHSFARIVPPPWSTRSLCAACLPRPGRTSHCFSDTHHSALASRPTCSCPSSVDDKTEENVWVNAATTATLRSVRAFISDFTHHTPELTVVSVAGDGRTSDDDRIPGHDVRTASRRRRRGYNPRRPMASRGRYTPLRPCPRPRLPHPHPRMARRGRA